jgi:hypothetical protein
MSHCVIFQYMLVLSVLATVHRLMIGAYSNHYRALPSHIAQVLRAHGIHDTQPDGELLANIRLEEPDIWKEMIDDMVGETPLQHRAGSGQ